jgi:hypothetical protein
VRERCPVLSWLLRFLLCALVIVVVVYVCQLLLAMVALPDPVRIILLLIIAVACLIAVVRYLGYPPGSGPAV